MVVSLHSAFDVAVGIVAGGERLAAVDTEGVGLVFGFGDDKASQPGAAGETAEQPEEKLATLSPVASASVAAVRMAGPASFVTVQPAPSFHAGTDDQDVEAKVVHGHWPS